MTSPDSPRRIAIACQGGGSHTAFTAGVLSRFLRPDVLSRYEITGMSGTSGGAICALLGWSALVDGEPALAESRLRGFWKDNSASTPVEQWVNSLVLWAGDASQYLAFPEVSPYKSPAADMSLAQLRAMVGRAVDVDGLARRATEAGDGLPRLLLGAVNVLSGAFKAFDSRSGELSVDAVVASAAIPTLFRSIEVDGNLYWDGLFSQNPPVRDLLDDVPDEIWVIQINPTAIQDEPQTIAAIADRRNELSGNLSLYQELAFIERIDRMLEQGVITSDRYRPITVRVLEMARPPDSAKRGYSSKLNRDPAFLEELIDLGVRQAEEFLIAQSFEAAWRDGDSAAMLNFFADDCAVSSTFPFLELLPTTDRAALESLVAKRLSAGIDVNSSRKQLARDQVTWRVRTTSNSTGKRIDGTAAASFVNGRVVRFTLGP